MIDHVGIDVRDYAKSKSFYERGARSARLRLRHGRRRGLRVRPDGKPEFWIGSRGEPQRGVHIAFVASDRASVDAFHEAALAAGATDNGSPGPRPLYHEHYYGAYVLDLDGNNVEAVCHSPQ